MEIVDNNKHTDLGFFGNIWVRQNVLDKAGEAQSGHRHYFDHVTMLVKGKVLVQVENEEPKEFTAPTFIVIRKEHKHRIVALEDNVVYYCVFALRDLDGEPIEDIYGQQHDPKSGKGCPDNYWEKVKLLDSLNKTE